MLGLNQLDAQLLAQLQMQQNYMQQNNPSNKHLFQNYSFDEQQLPSNYYDNGGGGGGGAGPGMNRMNLLQQAQSHSFNMEMLSGVGNNQPGLVDFTKQQQQDFQRNNPRRNTLRRSQRVDNSTEDLNNLTNMNANDLNMLGLTPQQHQQILMMRQQQYSNNSSGQESGIGSSVYTNSAHGTHDLLAAANHHHHLHNRQQHQLNSNTLPSQINEAGPKTNDQINSQLHQQQQQQTNTNAQQVSGEFTQAAPQIPRRKSLPSIVKSKSFKEDETAHSSAELNERNQEMFIIENGIRKRVCEKTNSALNQNKLPEQAAAAAGMGDNELAADAANNLDKKLLDDYDEDETPQLPRKIILESVTSLDSPISNANSKRVSMPSIPAYLSPKFASKGTTIERAIILV